MIAGPGTVHYDPQTCEITVTYLDGDCLGTRTVTERLSYLHWWPTWSRDYLDECIDDLLAEAGFTRTGPWVEWVAPIAPAPKPEDSGPKFPALPNIWDVSP